MTRGEKERLRSIYYVSAPGTALQTLSTPGSLGKQGAWIYLDKLGPLLQAYRTVPALSCYERSPGTGLPPISTTQPERAAGG